MFTFKRLPTIMIYQDAENQWRWQVKAANGNIIGASTEGYRNKQDCIKNLNDLGLHLAAYSE